MSALSCGLSWERASRMRFPELQWALTARSEALGSDDGGRGGRGGGGRVREATQADIAAFARA